MKSYYGCEELWTCEDPLDYFNRSKHTDIKFGGDTVLEKYEVVFRCQDWPLA